MLFSFCFANFKVGKINFKVGKINFKVGKINFKVGKINFNVVMFDKNIFTVSVHFSIRRVCWLCVVYVEYTWCMLNIQYVMYVQ